MASVTSPDHTVQPGGSHFQQLFGSMLEQYRDGLLLDFTIKTSGADIRCHRLVLVAAFPYFKAMFEMTKLLHAVDCDTADLSFLDVSALKNLVEFAYSGEIVLSVDTIEPLVQAARYLQVERVICKCDVYLSDVVNRNNCIRWYVVGSQFSLPLVVKKAHKLVLKYFPKLINIEAFCKLHPQSLMSFLQDDALNVPSEEVVIDAIRTWISHDAESRTMAANELLKAVRLNHCSQSLLTALQEDPKYDLLSTLRFRNAVRGMLRERLGPERRRHSQRRSSLPPALAHQPRFSFTSNKLLVVGGKEAENDSKAGNMRDCMYWERAEQTWSKFTDLPSHYAQCRQWTVCATDGRLFVSGGHHKDDETGYLEGCSEVWMWHKQRWHALPQMLHGRWAHGMVFASNKLFCFGGKSRKQSSHPTHLKCNEFLNLELLEQQQQDESSTSSCQWTSTASMKFNFYSPLLSVLGESIYILGMMGCPNRFIDQVYEYNIPRRALQARSAMPVVATSGVSMAVGEDLYVFGVEHTSVCMRYTPATDTWCSLKPSLFIDDSDGLSTPASSIYLDHISPLVFVDGRIVLAKFMRRKSSSSSSGGSVGGCSETSTGGSSSSSPSSSSLSSSSTSSLFVDEYDIGANAWSKSDLMLPACYENKEVSLFNVEMDVTTAFAL